MARVGGGKSRGCRTCRRRKIKCDERRPTCERCERTNKQCEGYAHETRWIDENEKVAKQAQRSPDSSKQLFPAQHSGTPVSTGLEVRKRSSPTLLYNPCTPHMDENMHICFLLHRLFSGTPLAATPWIGNHAKDTSSTAHISIRALGAIYYGRLHHRRDITDRATEMYGKSLISLNGDLQDHKKGLSLSVLKSAITLEIFEWIAFESSSGWLKHAGGIGRLIELRGPLRHQKPSELQLLEGNRVTIALESLLKKKRCFLERPEWKTVPWALDPSSKDSTSYLQDILCDMPGLMEDAKILQSVQSMEELSRKHQSLSANILSHLRALYRWRHAWGKQNPNACYETPTTDKTSLFSTVLYYDSMGLANNITTYNAILLLLMRLGSQVIGAGFDPSILATHFSAHTHQTPLIPPGTVSNSQDIAIEICRSAEYHLLPVWKNTGSFSLLFPLRVAYTAFNVESKEAEWLRLLMKKIADSSGLEISRGLSQMEVD